MSLWNKWFGPKKPKAPVPPPAPAPAPVPPPPPLPFRWVRLVGDKFVDQLGNPVRLCGTNCATWGTTRSGDPMWLRAQGHNVARMGLRWDGVYGGKGTDCRDDSAPGRIRPDALVQLRTELQWFQDAATLVVLFVDSNVVQNGLQTPAMVTYSMDPSKSGPIAQGASFPNGRNFATDPSLQDAYMDVLEAVAKLAAEFPNVVLLEPLPEPLEGRDATWAPSTSAFYQRAMTRMGAVCPDVGFLVGPRDAYNPANIAEVCDIDVPYPYAVTSNHFWHVDGKLTQEQNCAKWDGKFDKAHDIAASFGRMHFVQQHGIRNVDDTADHEYMAHALTHFAEKGVNHTVWQYRQNLDTASPKAMGEFALLVTDAETGADIVNTPVVELLYAHWRQCATQNIHAR